MERKRQPWVIRQVIRSNPERVNTAALIHALNPASHLGPFSHLAQQLRHRYLAFVTELVEESSPKQQQGALSWLIPQAFWIYYLGVLLFWLYDSSEDKQHTLAFLDRSLHVGVSFLTDGSTLMAAEKNTPRSTGCEYLFMARAEMGLYHTLHALKARVAMSDIVRKYL